MLAKVAEGVEVSLKQETFYPFDETVRITVDFTGKKVKNAYFPLYFRIPSWCSDAKVLVNGEVAYEAPKAGETVRLSRRWAKNDVVTLTFPMEVTISHWYDGATVVERGPLV